MGMEGFFCFQIFWLPWRPNREIRQLAMDLNDFEIDFFSDSEFASEFVLRLGIKFDVFRRLEVDQSRSLDQANELGSRLQLRDTCFFLQPD